MKVLIAGGTGAIGRPLVRQLSEREHDVHLLVRDPARAAAPGTNVVTHVADALKPDDVMAVARAVKPAVVVGQLTSLPREFKPRKLARAYAANNRVRYEGTKNLLRAAQEVGASGLVAQSSAFWYEPTPGDVKTEQDGFWTRAPEPIGEAVRTMVRTEEMVARAAKLRTVLLRYATFYGPGTWFSGSGEVGRRIRKRQYPMIADGRAMMSFVHIEDAAGATVAAIESSKAGTFNVADDEPTRQSEWLPEMARALGAKPPRRVPPWLARLAIGSALVEYSMNTRGADNRRIQQTLKWSPRYASWRQGFREGLG